MSETREYFQRKYPEFIDDIERRFNFTIGNLPVPTNELEWLDLVKLVYSGASAAKDASIRDYMNICEDLSRKLEEARGRIAELEQTDETTMREVHDNFNELMERGDITPVQAAVYLVARERNKTAARQAAKDARIAELEAALKPFADIARTFGPRCSDSDKAHGPITVGDLRNAHRAMIKAEKEQGE